VEPSIKTKQPI